MTQIPTVTRRDAFKIAAFGGAAAVAAPALAADVDDAVRHIKITEIRFIDLEFPGKLPLQWNAIKKSGGGPPKDTIMEIHTDQGIVGTCRPKAPQSRCQIWSPATAMFIAPSLVR